MQVVYLLKSDGPCDMLREIRTDMGIIQTSWVASGICGVRDGCFDLNSGHLEREHLEEPRKSFNVCQFILC